VASTNVAVTLRGLCPLKCGAVAALLSLLILSGCGRSGDLGQHTDPPATEAALSSKFSLLRTRDMRPTRAIREKLGRNGPIPTSTHRTSSANGPVWLVTASRQSICLFAGAPPASTCAPDQVAIKDGLTIGTVIHPAEPARRYFVLFGVVPDGFGSVKVRIGDRVKSIRVRRGTFSVRSREPVLKL
jgi:Prokaryotic lipoprotein-attachment site